LKEEYFPSVLFRTGYFLYLNIFAREPSITYTIMIKYYNLNGKLVPAGEAVLKVNDLAILRGYGIFDYFLVRKRRPLFIEDYLGRFFRSAEILNLKIPLSKDQLRAKITELIEINGEDQAAIRLVLTGGYTEDGFTPKNPNLLIMEHPMPNIPRKYYDEGVKLLTSPFQREVPEVKTINYLQGIRLIPELKKAGALEPLYYNGALLRESVRSNIFLILEGDRIVTPDRDILFGITRRKVLEIARNYFEVEERDVRMEEIAVAKEAFLTGSNKRVMPAVQIDDHQFGDGRPGVITRRLMELFEAHTMEYLSSPVG
jgi:branched-chain amino acid aminotransferase